MRSNACLVLAAVVMIGLPACNDEQTPDALTGVQNLVPTEAAPGESVGVGVLASTTPISDVSWRQVDGPAVTFHARSSKLIGFDVPAEGNYTFEVTLHTTDGAEHVDRLSFSARGNRPSVNARLDQAVVQRGSSSLRATHQFGQDAPVTYVWQQTAGPAATLGRTDQAMLLFDAPRVDSDTLLTFRATVTDGQGRSGSDEAWVLVEATPVLDAGLFLNYAGMVTGPVHPYDASGSHAQDLGDCLYSNSLRDSCQLERLPFIAQETVTPSVADIMRRVVVSHDWMGQRFEEFLTRADTHGDIRMLLRAVTGIVIAADVRPSFYWSATGGIYLDPDNLWLTPEERDTIHETPDYRSDFDRDLRFVMPWRLVRDDDYVSYYYPPEWRLSRGLAETREELLSLLYHELAHANDALPSTSWAGLFGVMTPSSAVGRNTLSSEELAEAFPLASAEMKGLASVAFAGATATDLQKSYIPLDVAGFFEPDTAADFYSYSADEEDFAELFSFLMLRYREAIDADIAVTNHPRGENVTGSDYIVAWGQRGRIGEASLRPRLRFTARRVLPDLDVPAALASLPTPQPMRPGESWIDNLVLGGPPAQTMAPGSERYRRAVARPVRTLPPHRHLPAPPIGD